MKRIYVGSLALVLIAAMSAIAASGASAAFTKGANWVKAGTKNGFTGAFWPLGNLVLKPQLYSTGITVTCTNSTSKGQNGGNGSMTVSKAQITFTGCKGEASEKTCEVSSSGTGSTITTELLKGELGLVAKAEATSEVGILFSSETSETNGFATLQGTCLPVSPTKVTGKIAAEATPVNLSALTGGLVLNSGLTGGSQQIKKISPSLPPATVEVPALKAFGGLAAAQMQAETITFEEATEVHAS